MLNLLIRLSSYDIIDKYVMYVTIIANVDMCVKSDKIIMRKRKEFLGIERVVLMDDFMDLYTAADTLGISLRTFERHVEKINEQEPHNPIVKIKRSRDKRFYYSANDVNRVRAHIDSRFGSVKRPGDEAPQSLAA
jgi:hypothetical protein